MDATVAGQAAREMEKVHRALHHAQVLVEGMGQIRAALALEDRDTYSALHTLVTHAQTCAERVHDVLRQAARTTDEPA